MFVVSRPLICYTAYMKKIPLSVQVIYGLGVSYAIFDQIFAQWVLTYYLPPQKFKWHRK